MANFFLGVYVTGAIITFLVAGFFKTLGGKSTTLPWFIAELLLLSLTYPLVLLFFIFKIILNKK